MLKQLLPLTAYHFPIEGNKLPFFVFVCRNKQKFDVAVFCLQQSNGSCNFPLVLFFVNMYIYIKTTYIYIDSHTSTVYIYISSSVFRIHICCHFNILYIYSICYIYIDGKPRRFSLIGLLFSHCANRSLSFVRLLMKKQTDVILTD